MFVACAMSNDIDIHELAKLCPEALLALIGVRHRGPYKVESVEVKATQRRLDLLFTPEDPQDPRIYMEWSARSDSTVERRLLEEIVVHALQTGAYSPVLAVVVYTKPEWRAAALAADVFHGAGDVVRFSPVRVVLTELEPDELLAAGGTALIALPLVGSPEQVKSGAREWLREVKRQVPDEERPRAVDLFVRLLAWRLDIMDLQAFLDPEESVENTATGQALLAKGEAKGEARGEARGRAIERRRAILLVLELRLGTVPARIGERLEKIDDLDLLDAVLERAKGVTVGSNLEDLLPG
jgi:hypothetical protein